MIGLGTIVNVVLIAAGSVIGIVLKKILPQRLTDTVMQGLGLAVIFVGVSGALSSAITINDGVISVQYTLVLIVSLVIGGMTGELIKIEDKLNSFAKLCEKRFSTSDGTFTQGFITATLVYCVGSMSILGSINDGISGNTDILFVKSALDGVSSVIFASTMGIGVLFSIVPVALYQGSITLLAVFLSPYLSSQIIAQMSVVGSILIMGIGFNMLKITKIKVGNLLPAIAVPVVYFIIRHFI